MAEPEKKPGAETVRRWLDEIALSQKKHEKWHLRGKKIAQRYEDERADSLQQMVKGDRRMNLLWSNVETLKPALYARTPQPDVQRRNKDRDPVGRWASVVLERSLAYCLNAYDFDNIMRECVSDYLLPGRGQTWVVYEPVFTDDAQESVEFEYSKVCYVHWRDFLTNVARTWEEVTWVAKKSYLTRKEGEKRFGDKFKEVTLDHVPEEVKDQKDLEGAEQFKKATVWEIWSKADRKVYFIAPGYKEEPLEVRDPFVHFHGFFPCPRVLNATTTTDSIIPVPDFAQYQDQADEIDELTQRIHLLTKALKVVGVYDATSADALGRILNDGIDNQMIPVDSWAMFAEKGGMKGVMDFLPIEQVVGALTQCYLAREQAKNALYEITGMGDVIRGASDPNETATAQQIKSQWGSLRVRDRQHEIQRFARDIIRLKAEVISEHFSPETLKAMSGVKLLTATEKQQIALQQQVAQQQAQLAQAQGIQPQPPQIDPEKLALMNEPTWDDVIALLRNDKMRGFAIDIQTDSTIEPDESQEKQDRTQLLTSVTEYLTAAGPVIQAAPETAQLLGELLTFAIRAWKVGETMETQIEQTMQAVAQRAQNPQSDPKMEAAKAKAEVDKAKVDVEQQKLGLEAQTAQMEAQTEAGWQALEGEKLKIEAFKAANPPQPELPQGVAQ